ncbi:MAG: methyl-accepting chemotaxis protein [Desulfobaccales bacterium]
MQVKLSTKLLGGFLAVAFITLAVGYLGWNGANQLTGYLHQMEQQSLPSFQYLGSIQKHIESINAAQNALLNPTLDAAMRKKQFDYIDSAREKYLKSWNAFDALPKSAEAARLWDQVKQAILVTKEENNQFLTLARSLDKVEGSPAEVFAALNKQYLQKCVPLQQKDYDLMDSLVKVIREDAAQTNTRADAYASQAKFFDVVGMVVGFALALALGVILSLAIVRPLNRIIAELNEGAEQVSTASSQVSASSQTLARGSTEQAASLEETSSSLEEMTSMTRQNAGNASEANALMQETGRVVQEADSHMQDLTTSMHEISQASADTAKIIKTIDEIAFQTNLLALNAAVEAARAGEAGAGFAVVADEVRSLAMRAAEAAKNTAHLIEGTVDKVQGGTSLVLKAGEAFTLVTSSTGKVSDLVAEITATSQEQAQGAEQISKAVASMDSVVQQNASNAEESASAAEELMAQAEQMKSIVGGLVALVSGNNSSVQAGVARRLPRSKTYEPRLALAHQPSVASAGAGGYAHQKSLPRAGKGQNRSPSPEDIIPMGGDDFKDF